MKAWFCSPVCVFAGRILMVTICLHRMSDQREGWKWLWKGKIKHVGETILSFDMGFSQHPSVSLD